MLEIKIFGRPNIKLLRKDPDDFLGGRSIDLSFDQPTRLEINGQSFLAKTLTYNQNINESLWVLENGFFKLVYNLDKLELIDLLQEYVQVGDFKLTSGKNSNVYFDIKSAQCNPVILKSFVELLEPFVQPYDLLVGIELGCVPLIGALSYKTGKPYIIIRKEPKKYGTKAELEGYKEEFEGFKALLLDDVLTGGETKLRALDILKNYKICCEDIFVIIDREEGGREVLENKGFVVNYLLKSSDFGIKIN